MNKVGRPKHPKALVPITVSVEKTVAQATRIVAAHQDISRSELVRRALDAYLFHNYHWNTHAKSNES